MKVVRSSRELRAVLDVARSAGHLIGFVPTMGALHDGHVSLLDAARSKSDVVVLSVFVNPLQFGPSEDLAAYPRDESRDIDIAERAAVDVLFLPSVEEMYPEGRATLVSVGALGDLLEGADRPGHFVGVATVVAKLFNMVGPHVAFFGQKDAQQVAVIKQMVRDLSFPIELSIEPTVRESDGLALSSRNRYLSIGERQQATSVFRALELGARTLTEEDPEAAEKKMWELLIAEGLEPSYTRVVDPDSFGPPHPVGPVLLVVAARVGTTRLIDNMVVSRVGDDANRSTIPEEA
ncbi:MAG: pantoate--beta-alanine ligase [Actinomycetota bacterium]|nr:pantoate--beta-alanine ligase [Actinomycetota bacterium]